MISCCTVTNYIRGYNPLWYMVDLVGAPLDDSYYMWVLENTIPYIPADVYHDAAGTLPWAQPIFFRVDGTLPIDIFYGDSAFYRLEVRKMIGFAPDQNDPLIRLVENYNPSGRVDNPASQEGDATDNQISNAQFSIVNFESPLVLTGLSNPDPIEIAPGWELVLTGNGSVTLEQVPLNNAIANPTNAPYALRIQTTGWTNPPYLRQRFSQNGMNWAHKYIASSFTARIAGGSQIVQSTLYASDGAPIALLSTNALSNSFTQYEGFSLLPASTNADIPPDAWIEYRLSLPTAADVYITSFQLVASDDANSIPYQQDTIERQVDHLFHYYKPQLEYKPIPSYLIGWDFPLNPAQWLTETVAIQAVGANKSYYAWDQTILFQTANNGISVARSLTDGISITAAQIGQIAMIQYLGQAQAKELLSGRMCVYAEGSSTVDLDLTISIWVTDDPTLPDLKTPTFNSLVSAVSATGVVTAANGNWTKVPRGLLPDAKFEITGDLTQVSFNGWELPDDPLILTATYIAIVISTETLAVTDTINIDKIGLYAGDIATRPAPQTKSQVEEECSDLYWKTYESQTLPGTVTFLNSLTSQQAASIQDGANFNFYQSGFSVNYNVPMRTTPIMRFYSPSAGTLGSIDANVWGPGAAGIVAAAKVMATFWGTASVSNKAANYQPSGVLTAGPSVGGTANMIGIGWVRYHYERDARYGIAL